MASGTIAVTGASGFIGRHLTSALLDAGYEVRALTRRPEVLQDHERLSTIKGGHGDSAALRDIVEGAQSVVHLAGLIKARRKEEFFTVNAGMTRDLLSLGAELAPDAHFVLISSLAAREPDVGPYGASKAEAEAEVARGALDRWSILRPPVVYGPGDEETLRFFRAVARGWIPHPAGSPSRVSMIHVSDLVSAILAVLESDPIKGPYELDDGTPRGHSWLELGRVAASVFGRSAKPLGLPRSALWLLGLGNEFAGQLTGEPPMMTRAKVREFFHPDWVAGSPKLVEHIGWRPRVSLEKGFEETIGSYLAKDRV